MAALAWAQCPPAMMLALLKSSFNKVLEVGGIPLALDRTTILPNDSKPSAVRRSMRWCR